MKNIDNLKKELASLVGQNDLEAAFEQIADRLFQGKWKTLTSFLLLKSQYAALKEEMMVGTIGDKEHGLGMNKMRKGLLHFIQHLEAEDLVGKALVISPNAEAEAPLAKAFLKFYSLSVFDHECQGVVDGDYDFLVFNDFYWKPDPEAASAFEALCQKYLEAGYYVVYFVATHKDIVGKNREQVHAAQSPFALFARVREMIEYLKYMPEKA